MMNQLIWWLGAVTAAMLLVVAMVIRMSDLLNVLGKGTQVPSSNKKETASQHQLQVANGYL